MLSPYPNFPTNYPPQPYFPSFVGLDFKLVSLKDPNNIHHLKIATQFNNKFFIYPHTITGTWTNANGTDVKQMTGHITDDYKLTCSWSSDPSKPADHFIYDAILTWHLFAWKLDGTVTDKTGTIKEGPGDFSGWAV